MMFSQTDIMHCIINGVKCNPLNYAGITDILASLLLNAHPGQFFRAIARPELADLQYYGTWITSSVQCKDDIGPTFY